MEGFEKARVKSLLDHFSAVEDMREPWRVAHPLAEILLLVRTAIFRVRVGRCLSESGRRRSGSDDR